MDAVVLAVAVLVVVSALAFPPHNLLDKTDLVGYAICHQIPERSYFLGARQLPLCARCTGTFLGAGLGWAAMLLHRRGRASRLPPPAVLALLVAFMAVWGLDGLNSYLTFFPGAPHLYEPRNWLRTATGMLNGLALIGFVWPVFGFTLWREPAPEPVIRNAGELGALLVAAALLVLVTQAEVSFLLYPVAILSCAGVLLLLTLLNSLIAAVAMRRAGRVQTWRDALLPLGTGLVMALIEVVTLDLLRGWLEANFGLAL